MSDSSDTLDTSDRQILSEILENQKKILQQNSKLLAIRAEKDELEGPEKKKIEVPGEIREAVRQAYKEIVERADEDDEDERPIAKAWDFSKNRRDSGNMKTTLEVLKLVKGWHPDAPKGSIRVAAHRYYTSLYEAHLRKKKNNDDKHRGRQRQYERRKRKLKARRRVLEKTSQITKEEKEKYAAVMDMAFMSSDHSVTDEEHGHVFVSPKLPWRSDQLEKLFGALDHKHASSLSKRSQRMERNRFDTDRISKRSFPSRFPKWAVKPSLISKPN